MGIYKTISSKAILRKVFRDINPNSDNWIDDAIEWIGEALEHIGASTQLETKTCLVNIADYKGVLPNDLYYINQVAINTLVSSSTVDELNKLTAEVKELTTAVENGGGNFNSDLRDLNSRITVLENRVMQDDGLSILAYCTKTFPQSSDCPDCTQDVAHPKSCYYIESDRIKTSFLSGIVCLSYKAFPTDDDCFPLVPDDISFKEAMFWYVYKKMLLGNMSPSANGIDYLFADQQWKYYCTQARNQANYPDIDRYESFMNQWVRLIPNINRHDSAFENLNTREDISRNGRTYLIPQDDFGSSRTSAKKDTSSGGLTTVYTSTATWTTNSNSITNVGNSYSQIDIPDSNDVAIINAAIQLTLASNYIQLTQLEGDDSMEYKYTMTVVSEGNTTVTVKMEFGSFVVGEVQHNVSAGTTTISNSFIHEVVSDTGGNAEMFIKSDSAVLSSVTFTSGQLIAQRT
jgi:hypothetical protein